MTVYFRVPLVIGHDEDQKWLEDSGLPAWGYAADLWRDGDVLRVDLAELARQIARLIESQRYTSVSAEFYDHPPGDCPGTGLTLRRIAILGGDLPQVKGLAQIPMPDGSTIRGMEIFRASTQRGRIYTTADLDAAVENFAQLSDYLGSKTNKVRQKQTFCDGHVRRASVHLREYVSLPNGAFAAFSEVRAMPMTMDNPAAAATAGTADPAMQPEHDHEALCERMAEHGADPEIMKDAPAHCLAEMVRVADAKDDEHHATVHPMDEEEWPEPEDEEKKHEYRERIKKYRERLAKFEEKYGSEVDASPTPLKKEGTMKMSEIAALVRREVAAALKSDKDGTIAELRKFDEEILTERRRDGITAFCEQAAKDGKLAPVEYTPKAKGGPGGPIFEQFMRADARARVVKFSEKGKTVTKTELEAQMAVIEARRSMFVQKFSDPVAGSGADAELDKVIRFSESPLMARAFEATGLKAKYVEDFKAKQKEKPTFTAKEYGVPELYLAD